jgi:hypothetical protein
MEQVGSGFAASDSCTWGTKFESNLCHRLLWYIFCGILHYVHATVSVEPQDGPQLFPPTPFPVHISLMIPRFVIVHSMLLQS